MSKWISFAWTTPAIKARRKTVTRRDWDDGYARRFRKGDLVIAYDRLPRNGGKQIALLRLTDDARYEPDADAPDADYEGEGFDYLCEVYGRRLKDGRDISRSGFETWRRSRLSSWVVRFEIVEVFS